MIEAAEKSGIVHDLPNRDGNLRATWDDVIDGTAFMTFLTGMETISLDGTFGISAPFMTFLTGMETHDPKTNIMAGTCS